MRKLLVRDLGRDQIFEPDLTQKKDGLGPPFLKKYFTRR